MECTFDRDYSDRGYSLSTTIEGASTVMLGTWKGEMDGKKLTIVIDNVVGNEFFWLQQLRQ
jgi:hypothetical protein